jgi:hypothetical protein
MTAQTGADVAFGLDEATMESVVRRVMERLARGERAPQLALPASKQAFPRLLCLDSNKWIELAKAFHGRPGGEVFRDALGAVRHAVQSGRLLVPVCGANSDEATQPNDEERRRRLATFMVDLSSNHSLLNHVPLSVAELVRAIAKVYQGQPGKLSHRELLVGRGMHLAIAGKEPPIPDVEPTYQALVREANSEPEVSVAALMHVVDRETIAEFRRRDEEAAERVKAIRELDSKLDQQEKRRRELTNVLTNGSYASRLRAVLARCNVDTDLFYKWLGEADHLARFTEELCGLNVSTTLMLARDRNPHHAVHVNDGRDYAFLGVAVPYGNVVVTENSWAHLANVTRLADKYETTVIARTHDLPGILAREGCT